MTTVADIAAYLQQFAPLELAEPWDNVGLLLGDSAAPVQKIMTCLTVTPQSAAEAVESGAGLIVSHHPVLFRAAQKITTATTEGRMLLALARAGIAVYSPHTAFDNTQDGINDILARRLGLTDVTALRPTDAARQCKIVVFVPDADLARVSDAMFAAGAGQIGQYRECSFRLAGTGTFFGSDSTNPAVGRKGRREEVAEWRLEVLCPDSNVEDVVAGMRRAHSYEEPAFDVYALGALRGKGGAGRIGVLPASMSLTQLAQRVQDALPAPAVHVIGAQTAVQRVALACGAAGELLRDAVRQRADVFLTGELRFHEGLTAQASDLGVVVAGHYATERCGVEELAVRLQQQFTHLEVWASRRERDPFVAL